MLMLLTNEVGDAGNGMSTRTKLISLSQWAISVMTMVAVSACGAKEPKSIRLTGIVYNYSQSDYAWVKINGATAGTGLRKVDHGGVSGGGGMCCVSVTEGASEASVLLEPAIGESVTVQAKIEKWWPDLAHYAVVHVLPGKKVVMQITPSAPLPRKDLLEAQQKLLGQPIQVKFQMWSAGPIERIDGKN